MKILWTIWVWGQIFQFQNILGNFDPAIHSSEDVARAHCVTYETLLESQENQILGVVHIGDLSGISTAHVNAWNPTDFMR